MAVFFQWEGWTAISSICQVLIALFAFLAILITITQIGNRKKVSLGVDFKLGLVKSGKDEHTQVIATVFEIWNYGLSPIFVKSCWLGFEKKLKRNSPNALVAPIEKSFIQPGEYKIYATGLEPSILNELEQRVKYSGKLYIFLENGVGSIKIIPCKMSYPEFKFEYEKLHRILVEKQTASI